MNINTTTTPAGELTPGMQTYYDKELIRNARPRLVHDMFAQKKPIPKNSGKTVEFRKLSPFAPAEKPLQEGVTPNGQKLDWSTLQATVHQYGDFVAIRDMLDLTAVDNTRCEAQQILGDQAGRTLDHITREVINSGTNVMYAGKKTARSQLTGQDMLTVDDIKRAATVLKNNLATPIGDSYIAIVHPNIAHDLMSDPLWENVKSYDPKDLYDGEIGRLFGVRFVESSEAKVFCAEGFGEFETLTIASVSGAAVTVNEAVDGSDFTGRDVQIGGQVYSVVSHQGKVMTLNEAPATTSAGTKIYDANGGAEGVDVYSTLVFGKNAYGVTEIEGGGLTSIIKQLGSAGSADPLNQRATVGWKATRAAAILSEPFWVRVESCSTAAKIGEMI